MILTIITTGHHCNFHHLHYLSFKKGGNIFLKTWSYFLRNVCISTDHHSNLHHLYYLSFRKCGNIFLKTWSVFLQKCQKGHYYFLKKYTVALQKMKIVYFFRKIFSENIHSENVKSPKNVSSNVRLDKIFFFRKIPFFLYINRNHQKCEL